MNKPVVTSLEMRTIDKVLEMDNGYVLDFSDRTFSEFFRDFSIRIDDERYSEKGTSKAKRLRYFLRNSPRHLVRPVLKSLLEHRELAGTENISKTQFAAFRSIVERLEDKAKSPGSSAVESTNSKLATEDALLKLIFRVEEFERLPVDQSILRVLVDRMNEAQRCIKVEAFLAAVILCGSVLEGICLGFGSQYPELVNRAYAAQYNKNVPKLHAWKLVEWIDVLCRLGCFSATIAKFGHGLRDFRNYVHPGEQLARGFTPDLHAARICFSVVVAAADDITSSAERLAKEGE